MMKLACQRNDILSGCMDVCALLDSQLNTNNAARELARTWAAIRYLTPQESMR